MDDSFGGGFNATQTAVGGAADSETTNEGVAPVLIKQIKESPEGGFQMWGMKFQMISCVAIVRSIDTSSTKITYLLEDHTGQIEAHFWLEEGDTFKAPDIMLNNYVQLFGSVRSHGGQKTIMVFKMTPVIDPNEICTHNLEVLNSRYKAEEFSKSGSDNFASSSMATVNNGDDMSTTGLEGKHLAVYQAIKSNTSQEGITKGELSRKFSHMDRKTLDDILEFMCAEGHIYNSIDPDHYVATN